MIFGGDKLMSMIDCTLAYGLGLGHYTIGYETSRANNKNGHQY
jgi:hypothetical protein